ncbi:hypothetical protein [Ectopseudomonas hydrolytica]|uniref:hypothetical protein n=1 Tax=Ectopseudomonas hydrolytica TaxID=2493633 RepID=UPI00376F2841
MIVDILLGSACAVGLIIYWKVCSIRALAMQEIAVSRLEKLYDDADTEHSEKASAHFTYRMARHWWFMPAVFLMAPFVLAFAILFDQRSISAAKKLEGHGSAMDAIVLMYFSKNPLTAAFSGAGMVLILIPFMLIGLFLDKVKSIPTLVGTIALIAAKAAPRKLRPRHQ